MKIGQRRSATGKRDDPGWLVLLVLVFGLGLFLGDTDLLDRVWENLSHPSRLINSLGPAEALPTLAVDMRFANYNDLLAQRQEALESGVYIPTGQGFVTATLTLDRTAVPVRMRLLPGPAKHLGEGEKWNFDVRTRQNQKLLGMERFYLLDPADNNWLYEWAFLKALEREGILATNYQFVNLVFNGDVWGIYALQEGFGDELMEDHGRTAGVILEFDRELLWESIALFGEVEAAYADPVSNLLATDFRYFEIDSFRDATIAQDETRSAQKEAGIEQLRALQTGQFAASEVFDVEKYSRFLAMVDLWGAHGAIELANLRYYYNPDSALLEPIGYNGNPSGGAGRLPLTAAYNDPLLLAAYAREAQRLSQPDYLEDLKAELEPEIHALLQALSVDAGELSPPWPMLKQRQEQIHSSLNPVQPVFGVLGPASMSMTATIQIDVANVVNLPVEILGFDIDGLTFLEVDPDWIRVREGDAEEIFLERFDRVILDAVNPGQSSSIRYARFHLPITEIIRRDNEIDFMHPIQIQVATRILGLDTHQLSLARE